MKLRSFVATGLSHFTLSNPALLAASVIGGISTFILVPGLTGFAGHAATWALVVVISQAAFAAVLLVRRSSLQQSASRQVLLALIAAGTIRGLIIETGLKAIEPGNPAAHGYIIRAINSSLVSVVGLGLIGASLYWLDDYRRQYQLLSARSIALARSAATSAPVSTEALAQWRQLKLTLDRSLATAAETLSRTPSSAVLRQAAQEILAAVEMHLRPSTQRLWPDAMVEIQPLRFRALLHATLHNWSIPTQAILVFLALTVGPGSLVRSGMFYGLAYTLRYLALTALLLWISKSFAARLPRRAMQVASATLVLLPAILFLADGLIGKQLLGLPADDLAQLIVDVQTPVTVFLFALTAGAVQDRQHVLANLREQIERTAASLLHEGEMTSIDLQQLSLFLHHSVQSELVATAMQLQEAGLTEDLSTMEATRQSALERLGKLQLLDASTPPWLRDVSSYRRIDSITKAWRGIAQVSIDLPPESALRPDQWMIAAQVIEEGIANAIRHGDATRIVVQGVIEGSKLLLTLTDNGTPDITTPKASEGLGLHWLESVAPGDWSLSRAAGESQLAVAIQ